MYKCAKFVNLFPSTYVSPGEGGQHFVVLDVMAARCDKVEQNLQWILGQKASYQHLSTGAADAYGGDGFRAVRWWFIW